MLKSREKMIFTTLKRKAKKEVLNKKDLASVEKYFQELKDIGEEQPILQYGIVKEAAKLLVLSAKSNQSQMIEMILEEFEKVKDIKLKYRQYDTNEDFFAEWLKDNDKFSSLNNYQASWAATFVLLQEHFSSQLNQDQSLQNIVLESMVVMLPALTGGEKKMLKSGYYMQQVELVELFVQNYECRLDDEYNFLGKLRTREIWDVLETYKVPIQLSRENLLRSSCVLFDDEVFQDQNHSGTIYLNGADVVVKLKPLLEILDWEVNDFLLCVVFAESQQVLPEKLLFSAQRYVYQYFKNKGMDIEGLSYENEKGCLKDVANDLKIISLAPELKLNMDLQRNIKKVKQDSALLPPTPIQRF